MHWLLIMFIGIASSIDNFAVGLTYAVKGKKITSAANGVIAVITLLITYIALLAGKYLGMMLPEAFPDILGGLIILLIGVWSLRDTLRHPVSGSMPEAESIDRDRNNKIESNEVLFLSIALSLNAMGTAFGAGMGGLQPVMVAGFVSLLSFVSIACGQWLGLKGLKTRMGRVSEYIAAFLMIIIGIYSIFSSPF